MDHEGLVAGEAVAGCVEQGVPGIGLWRDKVAEYRLDAAAQLVRDSRPDRDEPVPRRLLHLDRRTAAAPRDNRGRWTSAWRWARTCSCSSLAGCRGSKDLARRARAVADGIAALAPYAAGRGVRLAIEPLHPMFCADRAVVSTLGQALDLAEQVDPDRPGRTSACVWTATTSGGIRSC